MDAVSAPGATPQARFDPRGLVELDETIPRTAEVDGEEASFDAQPLTTRQINLELRRLIYEEGVREVTVRNPGAKHSLGVGILKRCRMTFEGSLGYFACGLIDGPEVRITGRVGWSACENMKSGVCVIDRRASGRERV
jgi:methylamine---glutamate N-methyltransferase subunit B